MKEIRVLSLFDGISCARVALDRAGFKINAYFASETDIYAIQIARKNYPDTLQVGSVVGLQGHLITDIDLLIGGSPCQDLSIAKKNRQGLNGARSGLFWEYVRVLRECMPRYFILENVASMPKADKDIITETLKVEPIMINAALVSAQNRKRLFWTNIPDVTQPEDRGILLKDILEPGISDEYFVKAKSNTVRSSGRGSGLGDKHNWDSIQVNACSFRGRNVVAGKRKDILGAKTEQRLEIGGEKANTITKVYKDSMVRIGQIGKGGQGDRIYSPKGKSVALSALGGGRGAKTGLYQTEHETIRKLTPIECERLQCLPDNYTAGVSNSQRYKMLGNAFNVDVVAHIVSFII